MSSDVCCDDSGSGSVASLRVGSLITLSSRYRFIRGRRIVGIQRLLRVDGPKQLGNVLEHGVGVESLMPLDRLFCLCRAAVGALVQLVLGLSCSFECRVAAHDLVLT